MLANVMVKAGYNDELVGVESKDRCDVTEDIDYAIGSASSYFFKKNQKSKPTDDDQEISHGSLNGPSSGDDKVVWHGLIDGLVEQ